MELPILSRCPVAREGGNHFEDIYISRRLSRRLTTLAKTVLRQQEELKVLRQDTGFILFLKLGEDGVMSVLYKAAVKFKAKQEVEPTWQLGQLPLRTVLAPTMFKELTESTEPNVGLSGEAEESHRQRLERFHRLEIPKVERGPATAGGGLIETADPGRSNVGPLCHRPPVPQASNHNKVSLQAQTDGNHVGPSNLSVGHLIAVPQRDHHVGHHEGSTKQHSVPTGGDGLQNGGTGLRGTGEADPGHDTPSERTIAELHEQATKLVLINQGNACYMNCLDSGDGMADY